jgi:hypothetical protein
MAAVCSVVSAALVLGGPAWSPLRAESDAHRTVAHSDLIERGGSDRHDDCAVRDQHPNHAGDAHGGPSTGDRRASDDAIAASTGRTSQPPAQSISVTVPATAMLRLDADGRIEAAWTNTGCPPSSDLDLWLMAADGSITAAPASWVDGVDDVDWLGDFSEPGVFVDQRGAER